MGEGIDEAGRQLDSSSGYLRPRTDVRRSAMHHASCIRRLEGVQDRILKWATWEHLEGRVSWQLVDFWDLYLHFMCLNLNDGTIALEDQIDHWITVS